MSLMMPMRFMTMKTTDVSDVHFMIRLTKYGNFPKYGSVYMFQAPFFKENSTVTVIM